MATKGKHLLTLLLSALAAVTARAETDFYQEIEPILMDYCFDCHGDGMDKGEFALDEYTDLGKHLNDHDLWLAVWENTRSQIMPPSDKPQPSTADATRLKNWIEREVFQLDPENPDPGRVTIRRLNRQEYENTIKDVFDYTYRTTGQFPPDDTGYGFDTIGDVLSISPLLMEKYVRAAQDIVKEVVHVDGKINPTYYLGGSSFKGEKGKANFVPLEKPAKFVGEQKIYHPGAFDFYVRYRTKGRNNILTEQAKMIFKVNGKKVAERGLETGSGQMLDLRFKAPLVKEQNKLTIEVADIKPLPEGENRIGLEVHSMSMTGPLDGSNQIWPKDYEKIFIDGPPSEDRAGHEAYARRLFDHWGLRLFRRPVDEPTMERLLSLVEVMEDEGLSFEHGIAQGLTAMLASPKFLFRAEIQPQPNVPGKTVPIDEFALASRLSYFLWTSAPDEELLKLANEGRLRAELGAQIDRMIANWKSERFVDNFTGQWLQTRDLDLINISPDRILRKSRGEAEKYYNSRVKQAMKDEVEMLFSYILKEGRPLEEFLAADYTFLNEDLAYTYGIEGVEGREMRKVSLKPEHKRGGILTKGAFLTVTSDPTRTSPVKRGMFVLENLLGTPAPPAPEEVPTVEEQRKKSGQKELTMRELMEVHRKEALCASCHARMDPIGLALENYNAIGMWRELENGKPIDSAGELVTGEAFSNADELSKVLATTRREDFLRCVSEKVLTYAIGRGVEYYDGPTIEAIVQQTKDSGGTLRDLVHAVVDSKPFQYRRGDGERLTQANP